MDRQHAAMETLFRGLTKWFFVAFFAMLAFCVVAFFWVRSSSGPARSVGDSFVAALREGDFDRAFQLCSPGLQRELGTSKDLADRLRHGQLMYFPDVWASIRTVGSEVELGGRAARDERRNMPRDPNRGNVTIWLTQRNGEWRVSAVRSRVPPDEARIGSRGL